MSSRISRIPYNTTPELQACLAILASHAQVSMQALAVIAVANWIDDEKVWLEEAEKKRPIGMNMERDPEIIKKIKKAMKVRKCSSSEIIHLCVKTEIEKRIRAWGCAEPRQFLEVIKSDDPLAVIKSA